jgi:hypothetical protein
MAPLLIALPWLFGFARGGAETWVPVALGIAGLIVTFFTDHEYGIMRKIPMIGHLWVDGSQRPFAGGVALGFWIRGCCVDSTFGAGAYRVHRGPRHQNGAF